MTWLLFDLNGTLLDPGDKHVYQLGIKRARVQPTDICLVAAHPWDLLGASRAAMETAYLARTSPWPEMLDEPTWQAPDLTALGTLLP